ncbi:MAG: hypothetical protein ACOCSE_00180 [Chitinivibrionales bacterium]
MGIRKTHLQEKLRELGYKERNGVYVPDSTGDIEKEYTYIRETAGVTDFSFVQKYRVPEESGIDFLDEVFPGNIAQLRFGNVLHTFLADEKGEIKADCYIANNNDEFLLLFESLYTDEELDRILNDKGGKEAGLVNLTDSLAVINVDGVKSYQVMKNIFGMDVLGLPYLSVEEYEIFDRSIEFIRAGKTGEFGYKLIAPQEIAEDLMDKLINEAGVVGGGLCGVSVHDIVRLDGRFFNIHQEGERVKDPLSLGLQWMIDFEKDNYIGAEEILKRRKKGVGNKITGVKVSGDKSEFRPGAVLYDGDNEAGSIQNASYSYVLGHRVGLALLPADIAYPGVSLCMEDGTDVSTISMPPFTPKSLSINLDEV